MAFNKAKALQEAEKSVVQGKTSQAIKQYLDIVEKDPSDIALLNTVGDLYVRERNISEALKQFNKLADSYVQEGFNVKAIAIYKKITKLDPNTVDPLIKLAELYQVQGLGREARDQYVQAAEFFKKRNLNDKAADVLRKVVQIDPENAQARARLANFLEQTGKKEEAAQVSIESAELALRRGDVVAAEAALKKALGLNPKSSPAQLLRARLAMARQNPAEAEQIIESAPELKQDPAGKHLLLEAYLAARKVEKAEDLVVEVYRAGGDFAHVASFSALCLEKGEIDAALQPLSELADALIEKKETAPLIEALRRIWSKSSHHVATLELLYHVCQKGADEFTLPEVLEALGHAYTQAGEFAKAEQAYQKLADREPENEHYKNLLKQVQQKQGKEVVQARAAELTRDDVALTLESEPLAAPVVEDAEEAKMVKEALDNSDLFARYNLPEKAVVELEKVLAVYPDQVDIHNRILEICRKALPERASQAAAALARINAQRGDAASTKRYHDIAGGLQAPPGEEAAPQAEPAVSAPPDAGAALAPAPRSSATEVDLTTEFGGTTTEAAEPPASQAVPPGFDLTVPLAAQAAPEVTPAAELAPAAALEEVDLSGEWEAHAATTIEAPAPSLAKPVEAAAFNFEESSVEIGFYLENGFEEEARKTVEDLELRFPGNPQVAELHRRVEAKAKAEAPTEAPAHLEVVPPATEAVEAASPLAPPPSENPETWELPTSYATPPETPPPAVEAPAPPPVAAAPAPAPVAKAPAPSPVAEAPPPVAKAPSPAPAPVEAAPSAPPPPSRATAPAGGGADLLGDLAGDLASSLEGLSGAASPPSAVSAAAGAAASPLSGLLEEMGGSAGEASAQPEDPETHYNLGVAFREMGLLDEAIGEFQKVVKGTGKGKYPPNFLQSCSLLAVCFMDKKMPAVAVKWYLRALESPNLDEESVLALQYDLGTAYEMAGDTSTALEKFTEVYSQNIDFRDVAEKIRTLQQKAT